ncbi:MULTISPECIES: hypothetical protein [Xanthomonas]|uniref:DUF4402 domain-containing protein n=1 Tax=Xanthomonas sacchari TaxID=56458 RepID=A0AA46YAZ6_9XANT|nr:MULTISPECIES: hypothetical protein [Xanthomonas]UYK90701.1 hypothetical protein NG824_10110 [Xanthomonas sacchari]
MIIGKIAAIATLALAAGSAQAWTLVYATDSNGNISSGSLQTLRTAVDSGASVRVLITAPNNNPEHVWGLLCTNTSLRLDSSQAVVCSSDQDLSMNVAMGSQFGAVSNPAYSAHFLLNTSGQFVQANIRVSNGELLSNTKYTYAMRWYVE